MARFVKFFNEISLRDLPRVGGKNASLGEMYQNLSSKGIKVPYGFASTASSYREFLKFNNLIPGIKNELDKLDGENYSNLSVTGKRIRKLFLDSKIPDEITGELRQGFDHLRKSCGPEATFAVRSSATAEDLPNASFAGQQETFLNISTWEQLIGAIQKCYASLFTGRAIQYRQDRGFDHLKVALSIGVQLMIRSDKASSGVIFTLDPDSGFDKVILITGSWGLGENVVQGSVNTDEYVLYKPTLEMGRNAIISSKLGSKNKMMVCANPENGVTSHDRISNMDTPQEKRDQYILDKKEVMKLGHWALEIEKHYDRPMDIEWAKDGVTNDLYIVQARPETVHSQKTGITKVDEYHLKESGEVLCQGIGLGNKIVSGKARILHSTAEAGKLEKGEILVTEKTNPDWDILLKKAGAIVTDQGGRTSHAAIVAREVGSAAIVGTGNGTARISEGQEITVTCAGSEAGKIFRGKLNWERKALDIGHIEMPQTGVMFILGNPEEAFRVARFPNNGIGLMRLEFVINNTIRIHPMALKYFAQVKNKAAREKIEELTHHFPDKSDYFVDKLAEGIATIAAAFYPNDVIVRTSDFKSNEYADLIGGSQFEPREDNPMLGFRGASRYYHPHYREGFELECHALKKAREELGLENVKIMIPFCRTLKEAEKVIGLMEDFGLKRGENGLELYMMVEIPSNVILAEEFAKFFDGFSIGSNDLTQLALGTDRDSQLLTEVYDPSDPAVKKMISMVIKTARKTGTRIGLCGQAPSDDPAYAQFLVNEGISTISFTPDAWLKGVENIKAAEEKVLVNK